MAMTASAGKRSPAFDMPIFAVLGVGLLVSVGLMVFESLYGVGFGKKIRGFRPHDLIFSPI